MHRQPLLQHLPPYRLPGLAARWRPGSGLLLFALLAGCSAGSNPANADADAAATPMGAHAAGDVASRSSTASAASAASAAIPASATPLAARQGELTNPDNASMVFLYYDLAGLSPPIDQWVEQDRRVTEARPADKAAQRTAVKAAIEAGLASVQDVGVLHLTMGADLSSYDPTYGEFTLGALSPASSYAFTAQGQTVNLRFDNGPAAQSWAVPADQSQAIVDKLGSDRLTVDATLTIVKVLPSPDGGTLVTHIVSWQLRNASGNSIARMQVSRP